METSIINLPGYKVNEYKIILTPHEDLSKRIMAIQKTFIEKFDVEYKSVFLPQLILVTFKQIPAFETRILNRLKMVGLAFHPFKVELKDFGSYPAHTIYINVTSRNDIVALVKKIREDSQRLMKLDATNKPHFINDAHITVARKLKPWQYEKGWLEYSHLHFTGKFIASKMILLRKKEADFSFKPIESFDFKNLPIESRQGQLFNL